MTAVAIVGPTASGKSELALRVAEELGGEIVSADSRQVYREMDVGTAKPTAAERARVRHHMIDVADPAERYDAARYQREARAVLDALRLRGTRAVVVGGTGLYVRALLDGLDLAGVPSNPGVRAQLERRLREEGPEALRSELMALDPPAAAKVGPRNSRRLVRYLEVARIAGSVTEAQRRLPPVPALKVGLRPPRPWLDWRIQERVRAMVDGGVLEETRSLVSRGLDPSLPGMTGHGYVHWMRHLRGECDLETAIGLTARDTRAYSRRQMTWFRRDPQIRWVDPTADDPLAVVLAAAWCQTRTR